MNEWKNKKIKRRKLKEWKIEWIKKEKEKMKEREEKTKERKIERKRKFKWMKKEKERKEENKRKENYKKEIYWMNEKRKKKASEKRQRKKEKRKERLNSTDHMPTIIQCMAYKFSRPTSIYKCQEPLNIILVIEFLASLHSTPSSLFPKDSCILLHNPTLIYLLIFVTEIL